MAQADRVQAGDKAISANRTLNPVIEQANRLDAFQGGPGINSQNDATGLQMHNNRKRATPDGDSSYDSSGPWRRTMKRRTDTTRHRGEWELFNSSTVSAFGVAPSSSRPTRYGIPYLPVDVDGDGELSWLTNDADEFGTSGPRSIERRTLSSGVRQQIYDFDGATTELDTSEVVQVCVRRKFGSSGNHYTAWVDSSDLSSSSGIIPRWDQITDATADVDMLPSTSGTLTLDIGTTSRRWSSISSRATNGWVASVPKSSAGYGGGLTITNSTLSGLLPAVFLFAYGKMVLDSSDALFLDSAQIIMNNVPSSSSAPAGPSNLLWIDSADNTLKVKP